MKTIIHFKFACILFILVSNSITGQSVRLLAGKYTEKSEKGLTLLDLNLKTGTFKLLSESDAGANPSYFCISKKRGLIYAVNELDQFKGLKGGGLTTLRYNSKTGGIEKVNDLVVPNGGPCFISLSNKEDFLFMANYTGGSVAVIKLDKNGIPANVSDSIIFKGEGNAVSHAHMIAPDPAGKRIYLTDLGLDRIVIFNLDASAGKLGQISNGIVKLAKGSGPRHFVFNSDGTRMYVICELNSTVLVYSVTQTGELALLQTLSTLAEGFKGESYCADIHIGKNGKFLYGSNRGENTIVTFRIAPDGKLSVAGRTDCGGNWPRNFVIDPTGKFILVANQRSGNISLFKIDEKTGLPARQAKDFRLIAPACLKFIN
jgi:6-phosphogluconolactonase